MADRPPVIAVTSGKGGVGKSTISLNLALALAHEDLSIGLLDADFYGPDIPLMVNLKRTVPLKRWLLARAKERGALRLEPVDRYGIRLMSVGFLIGEAQALALPAQLLQGALRQLLDDVDWGDVEMVVVDLPPGTADLQRELLRLANIAGALIVVGPQDVAHLDARKVVDLLRSANVRILGGVENMTGFECPHCGEHIEVFPRAPDERTLWSDGVRRLASIPLDPEIARSGDRGRPVVVSQPDSAPAEAYRALARAVVTELSRPS